MFITYPFSANIGVYISSSRIYLAKFSNPFGRRTPTQSLDTPWAGNSAIMAQDLSLRQAANQLLEEISVKSKTVVFSLPESEMTFRYFEMPILPPKERRKAVYFEAQKYVTQDMQELYHDFLITPDKESKKMRVTFFGARKSLAGTFVGLLYEKGAENVLMEPAAFAVMRLFYRHRPVLKKARQCDAFVCVNEDGSTHMIIAQDRMPFLIRDTLVPESVQNPGALDFESLVTELRLSFNYFSGSLKAGNVQRLILFAAGEKTKHWDQKLKSELGIDVETLRVPAVSSKDTPVFTLGALIAQGLASRNPLQRSLPLINLTPKQAVLTPHQLSDVAAEKKLLKKTILTSFILAAGIVFLFHLHLSFRTSVKNRELESLKKQWVLPVSVQTGKMTIKELSAASLSLSQKVTALNTLIDNRIFWTPKMNELARIIPPQIALTRIEYQDTRSSAGAPTRFLKLEGGILLRDAANPIATLNEFVASLKDSVDFMKGFESIKIANLRKLDKDPLFSVQFMVDCAGPVPIKP